MSRDAQRSRRQRRPRSPPSCRPSGDCVLRLVGQSRFPSSPFLLACDESPCGRGAVMEVRIGIVQSMKEIEVILPEDAKREKVMKEIETALGDDAVLWLTDRKGRRVGVPAARIAYVELGSPSSERIVGFGSAWDLRASGGDRLP